MRNAESPRLRQNIKKLGLEKTGSHTPTLGRDRIVASIENKTWHVLLAHSSTPPLKRQALKKWQSSAQCKSDGRVLSDSSSHTPLEEHVQDFLAHFNMEDVALSQEMIGIDGLIAHNSPLRCSPAIATDPYLDTDYSATVGCPAECDDSLPRIRTYNELPTQSQLPSSDFGSAGWSNGSPYNVDPELPDLTGDLRRRVEDGAGEGAGSHPSSFYSFDDWLSCTSFGLREAS
jgi:hypothetical protein